MFIRAQKRDDRTYLQLVENHREDGKVMQRTMANLGRLDYLQESGQLDSLLRSGLKFSQRLLVLDAHARGECTKTQSEKIGAPLLFEKLWEQTGIKSILGSMLHDRRFEFSVERALFVTVLHRLFSPGSDRAAEKWMQQYSIKGIEHLQLHHFYRAMSWLGEINFNGGKEYWDHTPYRNKDFIEESLFALRRTLFTDLELVFLDTTSIYFEGEGGIHLGAYGNSKDHRPDLKQMVVAIVVDNEGNPLCSEMLPGNTTDVTTLVPIAKRLKDRFGIERICIVADRGMISEETIADLEKLEWQYILGARMRRNEEVRNDVLLRGGKFTVVHPERSKASQPAPLQVKEVKVNKHRYIVCHNEEQARKDRHDREMIIESLRNQLKQGDKSLVGNKGYRKYLKTVHTRFEIDEDKILDEELFDGKWVLRTNTELSAADVALKYKQLWMVEEIFRTMKSIIETRPIYHQLDETITGHVFCSFLAMVLRKQLQDRIDKKGWKIEWADIVSDVDAIQQVQVTHQDKSFIIRTETQGVAGKVFQAAGVALPPVLLEAEKCATTSVPIA